MSHLETIQEVLDVDAQEVLKTQLELVEKVVVEKVDVVIDEAAEKVDKALDNACEKTEMAIVGRLDDIVEKNPQLAKAVDVIDNALMGKTFSCGCFGWKFSAEKIGRTLPK